MKLTLIFTCLCAVAAALGAPPENITGMKFRQSLPAGNDPFAGTTNELLLNADGTYTN
jgi:hypothetical protein